MRELLSTLTKRGVLSFAALVFAFSTMAPLATAQTASAAGPEYRLVAQPTSVTVETGTEVKSFYAFAEYRIETCFWLFGWHCSWSGWNDLPAWQNTPVVATVSGDAKVSADASAYGAAASVNNPLLDTKVDGTFSVKSDTVGSSTVTVGATVKTALGGMQNLSTVVNVVSQDTTAPTVPNLSLRAGATVLENGAYTNSYAVTAFWNIPAGGPVKYDYKYWNSIASSAHNGEANAWVNPGLTTTEYSGVLNQGEGMHYMQVRAIDATGNSSAWSNTFMINYDVTLPVVSLKSGAGVDDGTLGKNGTYSRVSFKLNDPNGALKEVVLNGNVYPRENVWNDLNWVNINKSDLIEGVNTIYAVDRAGNQGAALSFTYDKTAPTITVKNNYVGDLDAKIFSKVSFSLYDAYKVDKYVINGFTSDFGDNKWSDANFQNIKSKLNQASINTLTLYDIAGNSTTYEFTYDVTAPIVTTDDIAAITVGGSAVVTGTVNDPAVNTVEIFVDGVSVGTAGVVAGEFDFDLTGLTVGSYGVTVKAIDAAGNVGTSTVKTVVVNAVPGVAPASVSGGPATLAASPAVQPNGNVAVVDNTDDAEVLGESTETAPVDDKKEVLAATTTPEVKGANDFAPFGVAWYWWLALIAALAAVAWWFIAAARRRQNEEA